MKNLYYLPEAIEVPDSALSIVALSYDGRPYVLKRSQITLREEYDLSNAFPLMPYLTRRAEAGEDVPDYNDVQDAIRFAKGSLS